MDHTRRDQWLGKHVLVRQAFVQPEIVKKEKNATNSYFKQTLEFDLLIAKPVMLKVVKNLVKKLIKTKLQYRI